MNGGLFVSVNSCLSKVEIGKLSQSYEEKIVDSDRLCLVVRHGAGAIACRHCGRVLSPRAIRHRSRSARQPGGFERHSEAIRCRRCGFDMSFRCAPLGFVQFSGRCDRGQRSFVREAGRTIGRVSPRASRGIRAGHYDSGTWHRLARSRSESRPDGCSL